MGFVLMADLHKKSTEILLLPADELLICEQIKIEFPDVEFVDERAWKSPTDPPIRNTVLECSLTATIWPTKIYPELSTSVRENGVIDGPQVGQVIQWLRSAVDSAGTLRSGRWAASNSISRDPDMVSLVKDLWKLLYRLTDNKLIRVPRVAGTASVGVPERRCRIGPHALSAAREGQVALAMSSLILVPE
ncbi:hypothetical protein ACIQUM_35665 [Amycolatopsis azurea]|uniref:hypothetical protein n=1 Tax=Amycolatopsis azurea TaxID=36819 RepID=UPI00380AE29D